VVVVPRFSKLLGPLLPIAASGNSRDNSNSNSNIATSRVSEDLPHEGKKKARIS
jgi:hypothetical protein